MSANINVHGPFTYESRHYAPGDVPDHPEPYSSFSIQDGRGVDVVLYFTGPAQLDAHIAAATALRAQWDAPEGGQQ